MEFGGQCQNLSENLKRLNQQQSKLTKRLSHGRSDETILLRPWETMFDHMVKNWIAQKIGVENYLSLALV